MNSMPTYAHVRPTPLEIVQRNGVQCVSRWRPSEEQRAAIARGEPVWLTLWTSEQPGVCLTTVDPWQDPV